MGLKVWLPLNGDLRNQGTQNVEISNTGATLNNNGKIGKCYSFDGTDDRLLFTPDVDGLEAVTMALWVYPSSINTGKTLLSLEYNSTWQMSLLDTKLAIRDDASGRSGTRKDFTYSGLVANTWNHIIAIYNKGTIQVYINGSLITTRITGGTKLNTEINHGVIGSAFQTSPNYYWNGKINDVRIYDEALSLAEIKEISRGLVRHYKFDNTNIIDSSLNNINGTTTGTLTTSSDSARYSSSLVFSGSQRIEAESLPNAVKTVSVWAKTTWESVSYSNYQFIFHDTSAKLCMGFASAGLLTYVGSSNGGAGSYVATSGKYLANQWNHIVIIVTGDTTRQVYINGQLATNNANNYFGGDLNELFIGCRHQGGAYMHYFNGQLSDFRAYATQLSEADILELYQMGAKIDLKNKFHTYELVEDSSTIKINKKGQLQINELNETTGINFDSTKDLNTNELIEI